MYIYLNEENALIYTPNRPGFISETLKSISLGGLSFMGNHVRRSILDCICRSFFKKGLGFVAWESGLGDTLFFKEIESLQDSKVDPGLPVKIPQFAEIVKATWAADASDTVTGASQMVYETNSHEKGSTNDLSLEIPREGGMFTSHMGRNPFGECQPSPNFCKPCHLNFLDTFEENKLEYNENVDKSIDSLDTFEENRLEYDENLDKLLTNSLGIFQYGEDENQLLSSNLSTFDIEEPPPIWECGITQGDYLEQLTNWLNRKIDL